MNPRRFLPALFLLFVGSGCAALIYEIVWFQLLQLVIGSSSISLGVLLGTFMGGMCLGSLLLSRIISPRQHPLRVYAALELGIGVLGLLILVAMPLVGGIYTAWGGEGMFGIVFRARRSPASACCRRRMLMGATLPAISRWVQGDARRRLVARLLLRRQHRRRRRRLRARRLLSAARLRRRHRDAASRWRSTPRSR